MNVNFITHIIRFNQTVYSDIRLTPYHTSLYHALFYFWNASHFQPKFRVARIDLMTLSKVASKTTYYKYLEELHDYGYIIYEPSNNPLIGSSFSILDLPDLNLNPSLKYSSNGHVVGHTSPSDGHVVGHTSPSDGHVVGQTGPSNDHVVGHTSPSDGHVVGHTGPSNGHVVGHTGPSDGHVVGHTGPSNGHVVGHTSPSDGHVVGHTGPSNDHVVRNRRPFDGHVMGPSINDKLKDKHQTEEDQIINLKMVKDFFSKNGFSSTAAENFFEYYDSKNWCTKSGPIKNWKKLAVACVHNGVVPKLKKNNSSSKEKRYDIPL